MTKKLESSDPDALSMGELYQRARSSLVNSVLYYLQLGKQLNDKKRSMKHGQWRPWLDANAHVLGFGYRTAQRLRNGYATSTSYLEADSVMDEVTAVKISRDIWGNADRDEGDSEPAPQQEASDAKAAHEEDASDSGTAREQEARTQPSVPSDNVVRLPKAQSAYAKLASVQKALKAENGSAPVRPATSHDQILMEAYASIWVPQDTTQEVRAQLDSVMEQVEQLDQRIQINRPGLNGRVPL
jgi:hypothetical protein